MSSQKGAESVMRAERARSARLTRRDAIRLLGVGAAGAGFGITAGCGPPQGSEPTPTRTRPAITFPDGTIVRTVLGDVDPAALDTGATLFHEHLAFNFSSPPPEPRAPDTPGVAGHQDHHRLGVQVAAGVQHLPALAAALEDHVADHRVEGLGLEGADGGGGGGGQGDAEALALEDGAHQLDGAQLVVHQEDGGSRSVHGSGVGWGRCGRARGGGRQNLYQPQRGS